jgi:hypothetical protein
MMLEVEFSSEERMVSVAHFATRKNNSTARRATARMATMTQVNVPSPSVSGPTS